MNKTVPFIAFILGAAAGSVVTWQFLKKKYEIIAQEEIDSVKEALAKKKEPKTVEEATKLAEDAKKKPNVIEYAEKLHQEGYIPEVEIEEPEEEEINLEPYVIPPDEFGEKEGYEEICLTYYADGVLADDDDRVIHNVNEIVGPEALNSFGEYEDDAVHVRNERLKCDYEILFDQRKYSDVLEQEPYKAEV